MASVQELILAAQQAQEANRPFKGLVDLADSYFGGYDQGQQRKSRGIDTSIKLMQRDQLQMENDYMQAQRDAEKKRLADATESHVSKNFAGVEGQMAKPAVLPTQKLANEAMEETTVTDYKGHTSTTRKKKDIALPKDLEGAWADKYNRGEITLEQFEAKKRGMSSTGQVKPPLGYRYTTDGNLEAIPGGPADAKLVAKNVGVNTAFEMYEMARNGLTDALKNTATGPIVGKLPAFTSDQQVAVGGVAAMAPVLKQLFRVSGEGVFTDRDQALLLEMIPTRTTRPEAAAKNIKNINRIVRAKLGMEQDPADAIDGETPESSQGWTDSKESRYQELLKKRGGR